MIVCQTPRLVLRELTLADAAFILRLLNEPSFIQNIGDRKVRTAEDAKRYLTEGPLAMYQRHGHGLWMVERDGTPIGICGLIKRDSLPDVDVGYAFVPESWSQGYASEAVAATLDFARSKGFARVIAVVSPGNTASIRLLEKQRFTAAGRTRLSPDAPEVEVFERSL